MSQEMVTARRQLTQVAGLLRQGKISSAVQSLFSALRVAQSQQLMKAERDEFATLLGNAVDYLNNDPNLRKIYPLALQYQQGGEKELIEHLRELLDMLQEESMAEAEEIARAIAAKKESAVAKGQSLLDASEHAGAKAVFSALMDEYPDDSDLRGDIGERVLKAGMFEEAADYLAAAVAIDPYALHLYNRLGIALRKLGRFDAAEEYYIKALPLAPEDPNLHFNIGRMYLEWGKWGEAADYGDKAFILNPEFIEARKLADFCRRKMHE